MKQRVSNIVFSILIVVGLSAFVYRKTTEGKKYNVSFTSDQWQQKINTLETAKKIMSKSTLPANVVSDWTDSLSAVEQEFIAQIQKQISADPVKLKK